MAAKFSLQAFLIFFIIILAVFSRQMVEAQPPTTRSEPENGADRDAALPDPGGGQTPTQEKPGSQPPPSSDAGAVGGAPASDGANIRDSVGNPAQDADRRQQREEKRQKWFSAQAVASQGNGGTTGATADTEGPESCLPFPVPAVTANSGNTPPPVSPEPQDLGTTGNCLQAESLEEVIQGSGDVSICPSGASANSGGPESCLLPCSGNTSVPVSPDPQDQGTTGSCPQAVGMEEVGMKSEDYHIHGLRPAHELDNLVSDILKGCDAWLQHSQAGSSEDNLARGLLQEDMDDFWSYVQQKALAILYFRSKHTSTMRRGQDEFALHRVLAIMIIIHFLSFC